MRLVPAGRPPIPVSEEVLDQTLERYENGELISTIAKEHGISEQTLYRRLLVHRGETWKQAKEAASLARYEQARDELDARLADLDRLQSELEGQEVEIGGSHSFWSLARMKEQVKGAQSRLNAAEWELERVLSRLYGKQQSEQQGPQVIVQVNL